jgi:glucosyl-3-phosphoglycerate phosphatase
VTGGLLPELPVSRVVVWRHGRTEWNLSGRFQGQQDPPLVEAGRLEAAHAARHLAPGLPADRTVVVSSDLSRALDTATTLTDLLGLTPVVDPRLREHSLGCWEGLTRDEVAKRFPEQFADWQAGRPVRGRGGEEAGEVADRALAALADLPETSTVVVVTHAATAGRLIEALLSLGPELRRVVGPLGNCAWSELARQGARWRLMRHNVTVLRVPEPVEGRPADLAPGTPEQGPPVRADDADAAG